MEPDFSGWATKYGVLCTDGRTIMDGAFAHMDGKEIPLVWSHKHDDPELILGHGVLTNKPGEGLWIEGYFNSNPKAQASKVLVHEKNIDSLSIWANRLVEKAGAVMHGALKEVSLVIAGANSGAKIQPVVVAHGDYEQTLDDTAIIFSGETIVVHGDEEVEKTTTETTVTKTEDSTHVKTDAAAASDEAATEITSEEGEEGVEHADAPNAAAVKAFYEGLNEQDQEIVQHMVGAAILATDSNVEHTDTTNNSGGEDLAHQEGNDNMTTHRVFAQDGATLAHSDAVLSHSGLEITVDTSVNDKGYLSHDDLKSLAVAVHADFAHSNASRTFKQAYLAHAGEYGITNVEVLFPDAKTIDSSPEWITRKMEWVDEVLNGARKTPAMKIKSQSADLTHEDARAKGYVKGNLKKEQYFEIRGRETGPQTIYKKQKIDRDDILDAENFDIVSWFWVEMRFMLREEVARAILIGDGRPMEDPLNVGEPNPDKIKPIHIRPIATDDEFYTDSVVVAANTSGNLLVEAVLRGREGYEGDGATAFMTQSVLTGMLLDKDRTGRRLWRNRAELAADLEVDKITTVPVMKDAKTDNGDLLMIIVNMSDYVIGQTRGGEITTFEDFDIDYNQKKLLIETRGSGALVKHKRAQVIVRESGTAVTPAAPTFDNATGVLTIPATANVVYLDAETGDVLTAGAKPAIAIGRTVYVEADPASAFFFPENVDREWEFTRTAV